MKQFCQGGIRLLELATSLLNAGARQEGMELKPLVVFMIGSLAFMCVVFFIYTFGVSGLALCALRSSSADYQGNPFWIRHPECVIIILAGVALGSWLVFSGWIPCDFRPSALSRHDKYLIRSTHHLSHEAASLGAYLSTLWQANGDSSSDKRVVGSNSRRRRRKADLR
jgi:hypothetical protein